MTGGRGGIVGEAAHDGTQEVHTRGRTWLRMGRALNSGCW